MKIPIYMFIAISFLIGAAFLNLPAQNRLLLAANGTSGSDSPAFPCDSGIIMSVTPASLSLNFGNVAVGQTSLPQTITITNSASSSGNLVISPFGTITSPFVITPTSSGPIPHPGSASFNVTFHPTSVLSYNQTLSLPNNSQNKCNCSIALSGNGIASANCVIMHFSPASLNFTNVVAGLTAGTAPTQTVTISNDAASCGPLVITLPTGLAAPFSVLPTTYSIPVGGNHAFVVKFNPTVKNMNYSDSWTVNNNSNNYGPTVSIPITGNSVCNPVTQWTITPSALTVNLGSVQQGSYTQYTLTLTDLCVSCSDLILNSLTWTGSGLFSLFSPPSPGTLIGPCATLGLFIRYSPLVVSSLDQATLLINTNAGTKSILFKGKCIAGNAINMSVNAFNSPSYVGPITIDFGLCTVGHHQKNITIKNEDLTGPNLSCSWSTFSSWTGKITMSSSLTSCSLGPTGTSVFTVNYDPTATGTTSTQIWTITNNSTNNPFTYVVTIKGHS